jgi:hypothetical protein
MVEYASTLPMTSISTGTVLRLAVATFTGTTWSPFFPATVGALEPVHPASVSVAHANTAQLKVRLRESSADERFIIPSRFSGHPPQTVRSCGAPRYQKRIIAIPLKDVERVVKGYSFAAFSITYSPKELSGH